MHSIRWPLMGQALFVAFITSAMVPAFAEEAAPQPGGTLKIASLQPDLTPSIR
ncbi:Uncharacterised protein [Raoultella terrigena]|uniref:Uncharacterized protein n=1 Tax=Raoultella terrigena TaxID=577 RepID=A0A3P8JNJ8_RAOTE|nr:Uncharacterised protein [Raoultella terrigena]